MKKIIKVGTILLTVIGILYFGIFYTQNYFIKSSLEKYNKSKMDETDKLIRCNVNILSPEFAYMYFIGEEGNISFDNLDKIFWDKQDWRNSYTGGTTVKNTTFPELLKMVKEDCYQFQEDKKEGKITWGYREAEPKPTKEEISKKIKERADQIRKNIKNLSDEGRKKMLILYSDPTGMTDQKLIDWGESIDPKQFLEKKEIRNDDNDPIPVL